jgi:hypothetical protein
MAIAKQCDRCGKFYSYYLASGDDIYNALKRVQMNRTGSYVLSDSSPIDLCKECMYEFDNFMDMKKNDSINSTVMFNNRYK